MISQSWRNRDRRKFHRVARNRSGADSRPSSNPLRSLSRRPIETRRAFSFPPLSIDRSPSAPFSSFRSLSCAKSRTVLRRTSFAAEITRKKPFLRLFRSLWFRSKRIRRTRERSAARGRSFRGVREKNRPSNETMETEGISERGESNGPDSTNAGSSNRTDTGQQPSRSFFARGFDPRDS